jgi:aliphatic nitrilase
MILDPSGTVIGEPLSDEEGIVYAEIDTAKSVEPKQFHDVVGYYNRFDIFDLRVDRSARDPVHFAGSVEESPTAAAGGSMPNDPHAAVVPLRDVAPVRA